MTWSAPRERTRSTLPVLHTPVTSAPNALAICTAKLPTPPEAPTISTLCPGSSRPRSRRPCRAVTAEMGAAAACSKVRLAGLGASWSAGAVTYSANEPLHVPYTSSPGAKPVDAGGDGFDGSGEASARVWVLGPAEAEPGEAEGIGQAGHDVPGAPVHAGGVHAHQDLAVPDGGHVDLRDLEEVLRRRAVAILNNGLHRGSARPRGRRASQGCELRGGHRSLPCRGRMGVSWWGAGGRSRSVGGARSGGCAATGSRRGCGLRARPRRRR